MPRITRDNSKDRAKPLNKEAAFSLLGYVLL
jgi:hypothetical protein